VPVLLRTWAIIQKEFIQTLRDGRSLAIQIGLPIVQLILFAYAIRMNVEHIPMAVADQSFDAASRAFISAMETSGYFDVIGYLPDEAAVIRAIDEGRAQAGLVIPPDFQTRVDRAEAQLLLLIDGSDVFTSQTAYNAITAIAQSHTTGIVWSQMERAGRVTAASDRLPLDARVRILYNPDLADLIFLIPGMIATILQTQTITLTAAAVVREREAGTLEQLLVTPIKAAELMLGKMAPNIVIAIINMFTILAIGFYWFRVPFRGSFWAFTWLSFMYVFSGLGLGLLVSTVSENQKQSQQQAMLIMLVGLVLGGFIFPRYLMPPWVRIIGNLFPLTYFIPIARGIMTKGMAVPDLWEHIVALVIYVVLVMGIAIRAFRTEME
jgi:ABC-2 type transport system permease protein